MADGFWNGLPTKIRKVTGVVPMHDPETHAPHAWWAGIPMDEKWAAEARAFGHEPYSVDLQGQRIDAVEVQLDGVNYGGGVCYLDDRDGSGWYKVTDGHGSPRVGHRDVPLTDIEPRS